MFAVWRSAKSLVKFEAIRLEELPLEKEFSRPIFACFYTFIRSAPMLTFLLLKIV